MPDLLAIRCQGLPVTRTGWRYVDGGVVSELLLDDAVVLSGSWTKCFMWWCRLITAVTTRIAITKALVTEMSVGGDEDEVKG